MIRLRATTRTATMMGDRIDSVGCCLRAYESKVRVVVYICLDDLRLARTWI